MKTYVNERKQLGWLNDRRKLRGPVQGNFEKQDCFPKIMVVSRKISMYFTVKVIIIITLRYDLM